MFKAGDTIRCTYQYYKGGAFLGKLGAVIQIIDSYSNNGLQLLQVRFFCRPEGLEHLWSDNVERVTDDQASV